MRNLNLIAPREDGIPAAILYPALLTPEIVVADERIELILLVKKNDEIIAEDVNRQLKASKGLEPLKWYNSTPLFKHDVPKKIKIKGPVSLEAEKIFYSQTDRQDGRFSGMLDKRIVKLYKEKGFEKVYAVSIDKSMLETADNLPSPNSYNLAIGDGSTVTHKSDNNPDYFIGEAIKNNKLPKRGKYGFKVGEKDVDHSKVDVENLVQTYHPVFYYKKGELGYAGIGHMADIHLSSRQQILAKSKARVIEYREASKGNYEFKTIGEMVNICSENTKYLFDQFGAEKSGIDVIIISGDVVDHILNVHTSEFGLPMSVKKIWTIVNVDKDKYECYYKSNVDFLSFYSLVICFYRSSHAKPVYVVSGNHDCYLQPYGISPRVIPTKSEAGPSGLIRANEGIPADHNLTFYEASLAFGPSWYKLTKTGALFDDDHFDIFFTMFTPWSDFVVQLPRQYLVGLGWGNDEDIIDPHVGPPMSHLSHLGWADDAVSDKQLSLLKSQALNKVGGENSRKIILTSHFTFVCYRDFISERTAGNEHWDEGDVYFTRAWYSTKDHSDFDWGTFEKNREEMYEKIIAAPGRKIQCILTGHSHRRGFYTARKIDYTGKNSIKTSFCDFPPFYLPGPVYSKPEPIPKLPKLAEPEIGKPIVIFAQDQQEPWIIVSDSGGPIPRNNMSGEFHGWGSDKPSGTRLIFDDEGRCKFLETIQAPIRGTEKPRFVVALDYMDILEEKVIDEFKTDKFTHSEENGQGWKYHFKLKLADKFYGKKGALRYQIKLDSIDLYYHPGPRNTWLKIPLSPHTGDVDVWEIPTKYNKVFFQKIRRHCGRGVFLSIHFSSSHKRLNKRYDFSTPWTFEVKIREFYPSPVPLGRHWYSIERKERWVEYPDFNRRKQYVEYSLP